LKGREHVARLMQEENHRSFRMYAQLIEMDVPRELARSVLPVATYSEMYAKVDLSNLFKFLHERCHEHAQYEIRVYANAILELIEPIVPDAVEAFRKRPL
jgi:thymidylate synthase (FAD)